MTRFGITYDDVANAALQLNAEGKHPTIEMIRTITGTGSHSTIAQHLKVWKQRQAQAKSLCGAGDVPEEIAITVKGLWDRVLSQADIKIAEMRQGFEREIIALKDQVSQLVEENRHRQQQFSQIKQEKEEIAGDKSALEQIVKKLEHEKIALTVENGGMAKQLQEKQAAIDELHRLNKQVQANLEHYHEASREQRMLDQQRHEQTQSQLTQTINQLQQELNLLKQQKNSIQQECEHIRFAKSFLQDQYDQLAIQHDKITAQLEQTQKELWQHAQAEQHWQHQYQTQYVKMDELTALAVNFQLQLAVQQQKLADAQSEIEESIDQNKFLTHERWVLGQENAQLIGRLKQMEKLEHAG